MQMYTSKYQSEFLMIALIVSSAAFQRSSGKLSAWSYVQ